MSTPRAVAGAHGVFVTPFGTANFNRSGGLTKAAWAVYQELYALNHAGERMVTYASRASLSKRLGIHEHTARRALARLLEAGLIERVYTSRGGRRHAHGWRIAKTIGRLLRRATRRLFPGQNCSNPGPADTSTSTKTSRGAENRPELYPNAPPGRSKMGLRHIGDCL